MMLNRNELDIPIATYTFENGRTLQLMLKNVSLNGKDYRYFASLYCNERERIAGHFSGTRDLVARDMSKSKKYSDIVDLVKQMGEINKKIAVQCD